MTTLRHIITLVEGAAAPRIELIKRAESRGPRVGIFASSFNPVTIAHEELIRRAAAEYSLDEILALAGAANADKVAYECSLEDRLAMLEVDFAGEPRVSIGISSHAFYVDMVDALQAIYPAQTELHFIMGFDTFERVLDPADRYTARYHRRFRNAKEALEYLFARSRLLVAARAGAGYASLQAALQEAPEGFVSRILYLDFPADLGERSATEVREHVREGQPISGLVSPAVAEYIRRAGLYK